MSATTELKADIPADLMERAMALPPAAMRKFAQALWLAADGPPDDPELVRKETNELIKDRLEGFLSGKYQAGDAKEMIDRVRQRLRDDFPQ